MVAMFVLVIISNTGEGFMRYGISAAEFKYKETCEVALREAKKSSSFSRGECTLVWVKP